MQHITVVSSRGGLEEALHRVHAVAVSDGAVVAAAGDPGYLTYFRSSAKPFQALPLVRARPDLDDAEVAIACASHRHERAQLAAVRSLLAKADASEDDLECSAERALEHPCSGKHAGMILLCRARRWPLPGYRLSTHPCQQELEDVVAAAAGVSGRPSSGIDGCGVPTYALSLEAMATAWSRLEDLDGGQRVADAMRARPELVSGTVRVDADVMRTLPRSVAKYGAEGLLCIARDGLGVALKVEDGGQRPLGPALALLLSRLGFETDELARTEVTNSRGEVVGEVRAL